VKPDSAPAWPESEEPTKPMNLQARAALLLANWRLSPAHRKLEIETLAATSANEPESPGGEVSS
jgi:hypothetical protein